jgi:hypothetical protein
MKPAAVPNEKGRRGLVLRVVFDFIHDHQIILHVIIRSSSFIPGHTLSVVGNLGIPVGRLGSVVGSRVVGSSVIGSRVIGSFIVGSVPIIGRSSVIALRVIRDYVVRIHARVGIRVSRSITTSQCAFGPSRGLRSR